MLNTAKFKKLEVEAVNERLERIIKKLGLEEKMSVVWLKDFTYHFDLPTKQINEKYFGRLLNLLPKDISNEDFDEALGAFNDAWNAFPQKIIGDKSPQDKWLEEERDADEKMAGHQPLNAEEQLWKDHFARAKLGLDAYLDWAFKEVLVKYDNYVKNLKLEKPNDAVGVAGVFLEICGQMGFFEFGQLHPEFIKDFPKLFQSSVQGPKISPEGVRQHLGVK
jgi:hypothetical protein